MLTGPPPKFHGTRDNLSTIARTVGVGYATVARIAETTKWDRAERA